MPPCWANRLGHGLRDVLDPQSHSQSCTTSHSLVNDRIARPGLPRQRQLKQAPKTGYRFGIPGESERMPGKRLIACNDWLTCRSLDVFDDSNDLIDVRFATSDDDRIQAFDKIDLDGADQSAAGSFVTRNRNLSFNLIIASGVGLMTVCL